MTVFLRKQLPKFIGVGVLRVDERQSPMFLNPSERGIRISVACKQMLSLPEVGFDPRIIKRKQSKTNRFRAKRRKEQSASIVQGTKEWIEASVLRRYPGSSTP